VRNKPVFEKSLGIYNLYTTHFTHAMHLSSPKCTSVLHSCPNLPFTHVHPCHESQPCSQHDTPRAVSHHSRKTPIIRIQQSPSNWSPNQPTILLTNVHITGGKVRNGTDSTGHPHHGANFTQIFTDTCCRRSLQRNHCTLKESVHCRKYIYTHWRGDHVPHE